MMRTILEAYGLEKDAFEIIPFGNGLINSTWKLNSPNQELILQKINQGVFTEPNDIAQNINLMSEYLKKECPTYRFVAPVETPDGRDIIYRDGFYYRMFPFISNSHTVDVVHTSDQAYEAATQFGRFTRLLSGVDISRLKITIPSFHDLSLRYSQFLVALEKGNKERIKESEAIATELLRHSEIVDEFEKIKHDPRFRLRVTHHDTKISNVLFDDDGKGLCVIDLDTIMPGYFISDVGDMMRTYLSPVSEEETDFGKI